MATASPYVQMSLEQTVDLVEVLSAEATDTVEEASISGVFGIKSVLSRIGFVGVDQRILDFGVLDQLLLIIEARQGLLDVFFESLQIKLGSPGCAPRWSRWRTRR
jgi:hypothetical protein